MPRLPSATSAQLRQQFLAEEQASEFATTGRVDSLQAALAGTGTAVTELSRQVAHNATDASEGLAAVAGSVASDVARLDSRIDALVIPSEASVQGWVDDYLGINLADFVEAEVEAKLPVLAVPLSDLAVVTGVAIDFGAGTFSLTTKTIKFGSRGQVTEVV